MTGPDVSVVVVSHARPDELRLCLLALGQLYYPNFEIVVVADRLSAAATQGLAGVTLVPFEGQNISSARNLGAAASAGEVIAYIDDDAVPEPTWLDHLAAQFQDADVAAAGGYVIGRNGISLQWGAQSIDPFGWSHDIELADNAPMVLMREAQGHAIKTQGTNMAFRRSILADLGGFDPAFAYFHDETDLNMRVAGANLLTAIVPDARVHHRTAPSARRRADRAPLTLFDVGASSAVFHRKYLPERDWALAREDLVSAEFSRLERMLIDGRIEPKSFEVLLRSLHDGYTDGLLRDAGHPQAIAPSDRGFPPRALNEARHVTLSAGFTNRRRQRARARALASDGAVVTLLSFKPTARFHRTRFAVGGYWEQSGGIYGKSNRSDRYFRPTSARRRAAAELQRVSRFRNPLPAN